jgi:hypothetical protein
MGITSIPNFMKLYEALEKLLMGYTHTHTHRQTGDLISILSFLESRLKQCMSKLIIIHALFYDTGSTL